MVNTKADTISNIASFYNVSATKLQRHYKNKSSGYLEWSQKDHAEKYIFYPDNITPNLSIDEVCLSKGELYTIITNKNEGVENKKSLVAIINGTNAKTINEVLAKIPIDKRNLVQEITLDMARNMSLAAATSFPKAFQVVDRFHAVKLVIEAIQHIRIKHRWEAIETENKAIKEAKVKGIKYRPELLSNGDTVKELLARSRFLFYKFKESWSASQLQRAELLFEKFPDLKIANNLVIEFRNIYRSATKEEARSKFSQWRDEVEKAKIKEFNTCVNSFQYHLEHILNFFVNKNTNANAESFNAKIKHFRAEVRGVVDVPFFLFRLEKLFA